MPSSDLLTILLAHDRWATTLLLDACAKLPEESFHRRFDIGPGSLHDTLTHVVSVNRSLADSLAGVTPRPRPDDGGVRRPPAELQSLLDEAAPQLAAESRRLPPGETITRRMKTGKTLTMTRAATFAHLATHNAHHRAQCLNMLKQLGVQPLPPSSVAEWTMMGVPGR